MGLGNSPVSLESTEGKMKCTVTNETLKEARKFRKSPSAHQQNCLTHKRSSWYLSNRGVSFFFLTV